MGQPVCFTGDKNIGNGIEHTKAAPHQKNRGYVSL